jgi:hypothetical protein
MRKAFDAIELVFLAAAGLALGTLLGAAARVWIG